MTATILTLAITIEMIEKRYLKYYRSENEIKREDKEENKKNQTSLENREVKKIVLRDPRDSNLKVLNIFYKLTIYSLKLFLSIVLILFIILLVFLAFTFILSFFVFKIPFLFIGLVVSIITAIILTSTFLILIANFIFNRKSNFKLIIYSSVISLIILGFGIGFIFIGSLSLDFVNKYDSKSFILVEENIEMDKNLIINPINLAGNIEFIVDDRKDIKVTYNYNKLLASDNSQSNLKIISTENYKIIYVYPNVKNGLELYKAVFKEINKTKVVNYSKNLYNFKIYASNENLEILKMNIKSRYEN